MLKKLVKVISFLLCFSFLKPFPANANINNYPDKIKPNKLLMMKSKDKDRKLIFSDSPEYVSDNGILYQDIVNGKGRLFYYHLPNVKENKKIIILLENLSNKTVKFKIERYGIGGPDSNYFKVGKEASRSYYESTYNIVKHIPSHTIEVLNEKDLNRKIQYDQLVEQILDFKTTGPIKIIILVLPYDQDPFTFLKTAPILPRDSHNLRGTFKNGDRYLENITTYTPSKNTVAYFYLADNKTDLYKYGVDSTDNTKTLNYGNYGINYYINIKTKGKGKTSVFLEPLGGAYAGAVKVTNKHGRNQVVDTPTDYTFIGGENSKNKYAFIGTFNNNEGFKFEFTPPGASFLPVRILLVPENV